MTTLNKTPFNLSNPVHLLAVGFGSGLVKVAPGTFGSVAALIIYWPLTYLSQLAFILVVLIASILGIYICGKTATDCGVHDHGSIVFDEFVGLWIALLLMPTNLIDILGIFLLFRSFDIIKPFPIGWLDKKISGGLGIMLDDILAGFFTLILYFVVKFFILA